MADRTTAALIVYAAAGDSEGARRHLGFTTHRGADLAPQRRKLAAHCTPEFYEAITAALPWLADDAFSVPRPDKPKVVAEPADIRAALEAAKQHGLPRAELDAGTVAALIESGDAVTFDQPTGGRPRVMVRLREHDVRFNPFAMPA